MSFNYYVFRSFATIPFSWKKIKSAKKKKNVCSFYQLVILEVSFFFFSFLFSEIFYAQNKSSFKYKRQMLIFLNFILTFIEFFFSLSFIFLSSFVSSKVCTPFFSFQYNLSHNMCTGFVCKDY